jgi:hypothetical protein
MRGEITISEKESAIIEKQIRTRREINFKAMAWSTLPRTAGGIDTLTSGEQETREKDGE